MELRQIIFAMVFSFPLITAVQLAVAQMQMSPLNSYTYFARTLSGHPIHASLTSVNGQIAGWHSNDNNQEHFPLSYAAHFSNDVVWYYRQ